MNMMKDRIKQLMISQHMTQQGFADFIGIASATLSNILNGKSNPTLNIVDAIKNKLPSINITWLLYGEGEMFNDQPQGLAAGSPDEGHHSNNIQTDMFANATSPTPQGGSQKGYPQGGRFAPSNDSLEKVKIIDKPQKHITEIRIFFDDQTYESFVPKK